MLQSQRALTLFLLAMPWYLLATCPDVRQWPGHPIYNRSTDYVPPLGRRVVTVLASADPASLETYGPSVAPVFESLRATSKLSFLMGGCSGLMGSPSTYCMKGHLGSSCNVYDGFWKKSHSDLRLQSVVHCIQDCEWQLGIKVHLVASTALEEEIITGGSTAGKGDAFLVLPGGIGTTRELYDVLQANYEYRSVNKPVFCLDVGGSAGPRSGFFGGIVEWLSHLYSTRLLKPYPGSFGSSFFISDNATELALAIDAWATTGKLPERMRLENLINVTYSHHQYDVMV